MEEITKNGSANDKEENIHKDHRKRMRSKLSSAPDAISDHEIVEMLLYSVIPRGNTNEQAHALLDAGGSLRGILDLDAAQICSIDGLGEAAASLIMLLREFYLRLEKEKLGKKNPKKITRKNISEKLKKLFFGKREEYMMLLTVDSKCCLIKDHIISVGTESAAVIPIKKIIQLVLADKAAYVFLAHNHPNGILAPSAEDIETTRLICDALSLINVPVIEHYIVTDVSEIGIIGEIKKCSENNHK